ncbi:MAG: HU family DNA-binding protein [Thermotogae bacterium]|nr:HU family DNA-binding protein [Thermotogota bacterium]MCP5465977.1 HU family DNA-binding protein [Thermotogota bacterium]
MNKKELTVALAEKINITQKDAGVFIDTFVDVVAESLEKGEEVKIVGFGTFGVAERAERNGVNPQTKENIVIPAHKVPKFKAGKELKERIK